MDELKPCAYCGGSFEITKTIHETYYLSHEPNGICLVPRGQEFSSEESAINAVNNRPIEDTLQSRIAELENDLKTITELRDGLLVSYIEMINESAQD